MVAWKAEPELYSQSSFTIYNVHGFQCTFSDHCYHLEAGEVGNLSLQSGFGKLPLDPNTDKQYLCPNEVRKQHSYVTLSLVDSILNQTCFYFKGL